MEQPLPRGDQLNPALNQPDVYSATEIARAAGVRSRDVKIMARAGLLRPVDGRFFAAADAVAGVRMLSGSAPHDRLLFRPVASVAAPRAVPIGASGGAHAAVLAVIVLTTTFGLARPRAGDPQDRRDLQLVYLVSPGLGGGGGGGGRAEPTPPPPAKRKDESVLHSPVPMRRPPVQVDPPPLKREDPPPPKPEPPVVAPIVAESNDPLDRAGIPWKPSQPAVPVDSHGPGTGSGTGTGLGSGVGQGDGAGIGPGSGGGTGGGPYRPGSGITPPSIQREIKPDYTEDARQRHIEGDVVLEIVVRSDGTVGSVKVLTGLGAGLDERAMDAVRQWRFNPAHRYGVPVDVIVEVAVEFKLR